MSTLKTVLVASLLATAAAGGTAYAANENFVAARYRVVEVPGDDSLHLRARPTAYGRVVGTIPFDARRLRSTGERRGGWMEIIYRDGYGREKIGWANGTYIAVDTRSGGTSFQVTGIENYDTLKLRRRPNAYARVITQIPNTATGLESLGQCRNGWCAVRYDAGYDSFDGYVRQDYVAVSRPYTPYFGQHGTDGDAALPTPDESSSNDTWSDESSATDNASDNGGFWWRLRRARDRYMGL